MASLAESAKPSQASPPTRKRRRIPLWAKAIAIFTLTLGVGYWAVTDSFILRLVVQKVMSDALGGKVRASSATLRLDGRLTLDDLTLHAPGVRGDPGRLLLVRKVGVQLRWKETGGPGVEVTRIELTDAIVRVSRDISTGALNLQSLRSTSTDAPTGKLPDFIASGATLEFGEHNPGGAFSLLRSVGFDAGLVAADRQGSYTVSLSERVDGRVQTIARGRLDIADGGISSEIRLPGVDLGAWPSSGVPERFREFYHALDLQGRVTRARLALGAAAPEGSGGSSVRIWLENASCSIPLRADGTAARRGDRMARIDRVNGWIELAGSGLSATLDGAVGELACTVEMAYMGYGADAPFTSTISTGEFRIERTVQLLPLLGELMEEPFEVLSNPTGVARLSIGVGRGPPTTRGPAPLDVEGTVTVRDGRLAFHLFPYRFEGITGSARFTPDGMNLAMRGIAPNGVRAEAAVRIEEFGADPRIIVEVATTETPIDGELVRALGARADIIDQLFSAPHAQELTRRGLIARSATPDGPPVFIPGGRADVGIRVERLPVRMRTDQFRWKTLINVDFAGLSLLPEMFPLPIRASGVRLVIDDGDLRIEGGRYATLAGGSARVDVLARSGIRPESEQGDGDGDGDPEDSQDEGSGSLGSSRVRVVASSGPVDPRLIYAITHIAGVEPNDPDRAVIERLLGDLHLTGTVDADVSIGPRDDGRQGVDAIVTLRDLKASPGINAPGPIVLHTIGGEVRANEQSLTIDFDAIVDCADLPDSGASVLAHFDLPRGGSPFRIRAEVGVDQLDLRAPIEAIAAVFSPEAGGIIDDVRIDASPTGSASLKVAVEAVDGKVMSTMIEADRLRDVGVEIGMGRIGVTSSDGPIRYTTGLGASFDKTRIVLEGVDLGATLTLDGLLPFGAQRDESAQTGRLDIGAQGMRIESAIVRRAISEALGSGAIGLFDAVSPVGSFDASLAVVTSADGGRGLSGSILPRSLGFTRLGRRVLLGDIAGEITFTPDFVGVEGLRASGEGLDLSASGAWRKVGEESAITISGVRVRAAGWDSGATDDPLHALLPEELSSALAGIGLAVKGPLDIRIGSGRIGMDGDGRVGGFDLSGGLSWENASARLGATISEATGEVSLRGWRGAAEDRTRFSLDDFRGRARVAGIRVENIVGSIAQDAEGAIRAPNIAGSVHGGRLSINASVLPATTGGRPEERHPRRFDATIRVMDASIGAVLEDLGAIEGQTRPTGLLRGTVSLGGPVGEPSLLRGRGEAAITGGRIRSMPFVGRIIELLNLQAPAQGGLRDLIVGFGIDGDRMIFDELVIESDSLAIYGFGSMRLSDLVLDLRLAPRSVRRIPGLSDLIDEISGGLASPRVTGPASDPTVTVEALPGLAALLGPIIGREPTADERRLLDLQDRIERRRQGLGISPTRTAPGVNDGIAPNPGR